MIVQNYSEALLNLIRAGNSFDAVFPKFKAYLTMRGHTALLPKILKDLTTRVKHSAKKSAPVLTIATDTDVTPNRTAIDAAFEQLGITQKYEVVEDPTLIGGFMATARDKRIDASYKRGLAELYKSIIS